MLQLQPMTRASMVIGTPAKQCRPTAGPSDARARIVVGMTGQDGDGADPIHGVPSRAALATHPFGSVDDASGTTSYQSYPDAATGPSRTYSLVSPGSRGFSSAE